MFALITIASPDLYDPLTVVVVNDEMVGVFWDGLNTCMKEEVGDDGKFDITSFIGDSYTGISAERNPCTNWDDIKKADNVDAAIKKLKTCYDEKNVKTFLGTLQFLGNDLMFKCENPLRILATTMAEKELAADELAAEKELAADELAAANAAAAKAAAEAEAEAEENKQFPNDHTCRKHTDCMVAYAAGKFKKGYWSDTCCTNNKCSEEQRPESEGNPRYCKF